MKTRCKFRCLSVKKTPGYDSEAKKDAPNYESEFMAVQANSPENKIFFSSTPVGSLKVSLVRQDFFEPGKDYYIDITDCDSGNAE
jgi:hypothetical protein